MFSIRKLALYWRRRLDSAVTRKEMLRAMDKLILIEEFGEKRGISFLGIEEKN